MSVRDIESAIERLSAADYAQLSAWFLEHHHRQWEQQIEADLDSGRLDDVISRAEAEYAAGLATK